METRACLLLLVLHRVLRSRVLDWGQGQSKGASRLLLLQLRSLAVGCPLRPGLGLGLRWRHLLLLLLPAQVSRPRGIVEPRPGQTCTHQGKGERMPGHRLHGNSENSVAS